MATDLAALRSPVPPARREIPHTVSPGLWTLGWRRLRSDRVAMVSLAIVAFFIVMMILSATGLIASDWAREVGVNYAPPTFVGAGPTTATLATPEQGLAAQGAAGAPAPAFKSHGRRSARRRAGRAQGREAGCRGCCRNPGRERNGAGCWWRGCAGRRRRERRRREERRSARRRHGRHPQGQVHRGGRGRRASRNAAVRRRQVGPRRPEEDDQGLADVDLRRPRRRRSSPRSSARCSARSPATTAGGSTTSSTGSTACSARSPTCC